MNVLASMRYLVALNEHRHFGRAALASHITQPALSNALRALEAEFGVLIVKRGRAFAGLTVEGEAVLATAQRMLHEQELLRQRLRSEVGQPSGRLRLAAVPTAMTILSSFAIELQMRHPGIAPTVVSLSSLEIETALDSMSVDLALGYIDRTRVRSVSLTSWPQCTELYYLVQRATPVRGGANLRFGPPIEWAEAATLPLCLLTPDMHNRAIVDRAFKSAGLGITAAMETNSIHTLASSVGAGALASVLPGAALELLRADGAFEARPLVAPLLRTPLGFMTYASDRVSRALEAAIELLQSEAWLRQLNRLVEAPPAPAASN
ncbi:LysR substrate-binding domain-containing protein [Variovorax sp. J22G21]|uniref:LysR family transcriptional regulator n=1 Tax=Variovorax fucosicus TaxID=3053517 RepID=UPI00257599FC|nr:MULTISPECIES: LysR substrate-binding domain-containing protein [unclassified Variovorax]MDM0038065.1 LysR substrate-binding domain-containing protein [Variovorax sp. J22R193]MDM0062841.1 LysR substrate-binding domain-containing protein [Variovorax sp. J22G21]